MEKIEPKQDKYGFWYYNELPNDAIPATIDHFYNNGKPIKGKPYLVHSFIDKTFQAYRVGNSFPPSDFDIFLNNNRVFVFKKSES